MTPRTGPVPPPLRRTSRSGRIRALYVQPAPLFGGAERQAATLARLFPEFGVDVIPMVGPGKSIVNWLEERHVTRIVHSKNFPGGWPKQRGWRRVTLPWRYVQCGIRAYREIISLIQTESIDIVLASLPFAWIVGTLGARRAGIPVVWRAGGARINIVQKFAAWLLSRFLRPDLLLTNGEAVRKCFSPLIPAPVAVVPNGVDPEFFNARLAHPERYRPGGARWVVGFAGRLVASKRPQDLVALAVWLGLHYPEARLLIGGDGSRRAEYERLAQRLGAKNLEFIGFVEDMPSFLAACDVAVLASGGEGCSNFVLEAMAMGTPVVAAGVPPVLEIIEHTSNGLVFPLGDVDQLSEWVGLLLAAPQLRADLSRRGRVTAERFTARRTAATLSQILRVLVAETAEKRARGPSEDLPRAAMESALVERAVPSNASGYTRPTSRSQMD